MVWYGLITVSFFNFWYHAKPTIKHQTNCRRCHLVSSRFVNVLDKCTSHVINKQETHPNQPSHQEERRSQGERLQLPATGNDLPSLPILFRRLQRNFLRHLDTFFPLESLGGQPVP